MSNEDLTNQVSNVQDTKYHPGYNAKKSIGSDLVLLILREGFNLDPCKIYPIHKPPLNFKPSGNYWMVLKVKTVIHIDKWCKKIWLWETPFHAE